MPEMVGSSADGQDLLFDLHHTWTNSWARVGLSICQARQIMDRSFTARTREAQRGPLTTHIGSTRPKIDVS
jgi:hypothetical protein